MKLAKICGHFVVVVYGSVFIVETLTEAVNILKGGILCATYVLSLQVV